ncbi:MAG: DUF202 domain-containing protein, partial [Micrococcales bacterium]|nr:DUF202 domain-containing protein [Micrococcales bacterium]
MAAGHRDPQEAGDPGSPPPPRRWPASVYAAGTEPDPRFSLANERTFLAWIRTTLALLVAAAALDVVSLPIPLPVQQFVAAGLALSGAVTAVQAWRGWARTETAMRRGSPLPNSPMAIPLVVVLVVLAVSLLVA